MPLSPLQAPLCPICGKPNECAASASGSFEVECWCKEVNFSESLLAKIPPDLKGKACICRSCAEGTNDDRTVQGTQG